MICPFCLTYVSPDATMNYHEVTSWVSGPKLDGPKLRQATGRVAHERCIKNLIAGQAADQPEIFEDRWMRPDELEERDCGGCGGTGNISDVPGCPDCHGTGRVPLHSRGGPDDG